jgi:hypothetical protein
MLALSRHHEPVSLTPPSASWRTSDGADVERLWIAPGDAVLLTTEAPKRPSKRPKKPTSTRPRARKAT